MPRFFTLSQAERILGEVEPAIRQAILLKSEYVEAEGELQGALRKISMMGGSLVDHEYFASRKSKRDASASGLKEAIETVQLQGCLVKDLDTGLIDFPTLYRGEEVYLCWKLGESGISFWHGVSEGFRGRKKITQEFLENHRGDLPN